MRIAFVAANRETLPDAVIPLGLLYVMASTPPEHERRLWDLCFDEEPLARLAGELQRFSPDIVAIGLRNLQVADYSGFGDNLTYYADLVRCVRAHSRARIVLGGGAFSIMPRQIMQHLGADYGISGEGEGPFADLIAALHAATPRLSAIPNLHYFEGGDLISTPPAAGFQALDALPIPDRSLVDPRYYRDCGIDSAQSKRGCPLRCDYCTYPLIEGRAIRRRDPALFVDELFELRRVRPEAKHVFIVDAVFNLPPAHAKDVCREMIRRRFDLPWTCYANPLGFDRELAELMVEAGCSGIEVGSDSGVNAVLDRLQKGFHVDQIRSLHAHATAAGLPDCHSFILGTLGEEMRDIRESLDFCVDLAPRAAILGIWTDDGEALDPALAAQRRSFREEIKAVLAERASRFPHWVIPSLGVNFDPRLFRLLRRSGLSGPLWQHLHRRREGHPASTVSGSATPGP